MQMDIFYRQKPWYAGKIVKRLLQKFNSIKVQFYIVTVLLNLQKQHLLSVLVQDFDN